MRIRPIGPTEEANLRDRWFRGATVLGWATATQHGLGVEDSCGEIDEDDLLALVEIPLAGHWNLDGRVVFARRYSSARYRWSHVVRDRDAMFVLYDTHGLCESPMAAEQVARVVRDKISALTVHKWRRLGRPPW